MTQKEMSDRIDEINDRSDREHRELTDDEWIEVTALSDKLLYGDANN